MWEVAQSVRSTFSIGASVFKYSRLFLNGQPSISAVGTSNTKARQTPSYMVCTPGNEALASDEGLTEDMNQLSLFSRQYFQMLELPHLTWPSTRILRNSDHQEWMFEHMFDETSIQFPLPERYRLRVLKPLLARIEQSIVDPEEDVSTLLPFFCYYARLHTHVTFLMLYSRATGDFRQSHDSTHVPNARGPSFRVRRCPTQSLDHVYAHAVRLVIVATRRLKLQTPREPLRHFRRWHHRTPHVGGRSTSRLLSSFLTRGVYLGQGQKPSRARCRYWISKHSVPQGARVAACDYHGR